jgi:hypothetical protein
MTPPSNPLEYFRNFPNINEAWELVKTGLVVIEEKLYRLELWHSYSNPDIAYYAISRTTFRFSFSRTESGGGCRIHHFQSGLAGTRRSAPRWLSYRKIPPPEKQRVGLGSRNKFPR